MSEQKEFFITDKGRGALKKISMGRYNETVRWVSELTGKAKSLVGSAVPGSYPSIGAANAAAKSIRERAGKDGNPFRARAGTKRSVAEGGSAGKPYVLKYVMGKNGPHIRSFTIKKSKLAEVRALNGQVQTADLPKMKQTVNHRGTYLVGNDGQIMLFESKEAANAMGVTMEIMNKKKSEAAKDAQAQKDQKYYDYILASKINVSTGKRGYVKVLKPQYVDERPKGVTQSPTDKFIEGKKKGYDGSEKHGLTRAQIKALPRISYQEKMQMSAEKKAARAAAKKGGKSDAQIAAENKARGNVLSKRQNGTIVLKVASYTNPVTGEFISFGKKPIKYSSGIYTRFAKEAAQERGISPAQLWENAAEYGYNMA